MKTDSIVIVGGGSAGWMSAAILIRAYPEKNITLIESPTVPRIGVGESTYDGIQRYVNYLGVDIADFFAHTNASIKMGVKFKNFYNAKEKDEYLYMFGNPFTRGSKFGIKDWYIRKHLYKETPITDFSESYFPAAWLVKYKRFNANLDGQLDNFFPRNSTALHFDAIKFGDWLKNNYSIPKGVNFISSDVCDVETSENGIDSVILSDGKRVHGDLFIDCTGFKSLLIEQVMKSKFIDYINILPNNRAWATQIEYEDKEQELDGVTTCTAIENGWAWNVPLWSRIGTGYVYSDKYCSPEEALEQFKKYLENDKGRNKVYIDSLSFSDIKTRSGIHEKTWVKNVVAIGLSAGFIEPLEGTGLFTVHDFLFQLVVAISRGVVSQWDIDVYNDATKNLFDTLVEFIQMHYALSVRSDTKYWQDNLKRSYNLDKYKIPTVDYSPHIVAVKNARTESKTPLNLGPMSWISAGMNYFVFDKFDMEMEQSMTGFDFANNLDPFFSKLDQRKEKWKTVAMNSPTMQEYLKNTFYKDS